jgi:GT2 family glycosyltransferase
MTVGVTITTHNRLPELQRTCEQLERLLPPPDEVIICADGCDDGTAEFVRANYPQHRLIEHAQGRGSVASRNEMLREAAADLCLSLDDDSYPVEPGFIDKVRVLFAENPKLAVADFPQRSDEFPDSLEQTDFGPSLITGSYSNSGAVIRRAVFVDLGEYPDFFFHAYEEPDFALRCIAAGWEVRHETSLTVRHHYTALARNEMRTHQRHARNEIWSVLMRCPLPWLLPVTAFRVARQLGYACSRGIAWVVCEPVWWMQCLGGLVKCFRRRQPMQWARYLAWMKLVRNPRTANEGNPVRP